MIRILQRFAPVVALVIAFTLASAANAADAKGKIKTVTADKHEFVVTDSDGKNLTFMCNKEGKILINDKESKLSDLQADDEVVITNLAYGAITLAAAAATNESGATLRTVEMPHPLHDSHAVVDAVVVALTDRTKLVIIDHITAQTALVLTIARVAEECRRRGVAVLVDGAHAPGAIALDIPSLGVDWYSANLHKWAHAPRSCGVLWAAPARQASLHHPVTSWGRNTGFHGEFEHVATSDPTAYLAAPEGIALLREWDFPAVLSYMHRLAWDAAGLLTERWKTPLDTPREMVAAMATVPLPHAAGATAEDASRLRLALLVDDKIEVPIHAGQGRLWVRVSAQVYNDLSDVERLAVAVARRVALV